MALSTLATSAAPVKHEPTIKFIWSRRNSDVQDFLHQIGLGEVSEEKAKLKLSTVNLVASDKTTAICSKLYLLGASSLLRSVTPEADLLCHNHKTTVILTDINGTLLKLLVCYLEKGEVSFSKDNLKEFMFMVEKYELNGQLFGEGDNDSFEEESRFVNQLIQLHKNRIKVTSFLMPFAIDQVAKINNEIMEEDFGTMLKADESFPPSPNPSSPSPTSDLGTSNGSWCTVGSDTKGVGSEEGRAKTAEEPKLPKEPHTLMEVTIDQKHPEQNNPILRSLLGKPVLTTVTSCKPKVQKLITSYYQVEFKNSKRQENPDVMKINISEQHLRQMDLSKPKQQGKNSESGNYNGESRNHNSVIGTPSKVQDNTKIKQSAKGVFRRHQANALKANDMTRMLPVVGRKKHRIYRTYNEEAMEAAIAEVRVGNGSVLKVARKFEIPHRTLYDRLSKLKKVGVAFPIQQLCCNNGQNNLKDVSASLSQRQQSPDTNAMFPTVELHENKVGSAKPIGSTGMPWNLGSGNNQEINKNDFNQFQLQVPSGFQFNHFLYSSPGQ